MSSLTPNTFVKTASANSAAADISDQTALYIFTTHLNASVSVTSAYV